MNNITRRNMSIEEIKVPDFQSKLPESLTANLDAKDAEIMHALNRIEQKSDWTIERIVDIRKDEKDEVVYLGKLDERVSDMEEWRKKILGPKNIVKAGIIIAIILYGIIGGPSGARAVAGLLLK